VFVCVCSEFALSKRVIATCRQGAGGLTEREQRLAVVWNRPQTWVSQVMLPSACSFIVDVSLSYI
jgi:hypothetical protein